MLFHNQKRPISFCGSITPRRRRRRRRRSSLLLLLLLLLRGVMEAGGALQYASEGMRADKDVMLAAQE
jgi:hypothetical protein